MQTGITTAVQAGANSPDGQVRKSPDAAAYDGAELAGGTHVNLDGQQAVITRNADTSAQSSFPAAKRGRGQRAGK